jgi:GNAT superfamily N-acetyltransferase
MAKLDHIGKESLATVVELDKTTNGSHRRDFFTKRFEAQEKHPEAFISIGAVEAGKMVGFVFCHLLQGEFGGDELIAVLDAMAVEPGSQGHGVGHELMQQLIDEIRHRGGKDLRTQVGWDQPAVIDFFSNTGFSMAPRLILERSTRDVRF